MSLTKCQKYLHKLSNTDVNDEKFNLYLEKLNFWYGRGGGKLISEDIKTFADFIENFKKIIIKNKKYNQKKEQIIKDNILKLIDKLYFMLLLQVIRHFFTINLDYDNLIKTLIEAYDVDKNWLIRNPHMRISSLYNNIDNQIKNNYNIILNKLFKLMINNKSINDYKKNIKKINGLHDVFPKDNPIYFPKNIENKNLSEIISELYHNFTGKIIDSSLLTQTNVLTIKPDIDEIIGISNEPTNS
jgi:hypothetical protein